MIAYLAKEFKGSSHLIDDINHWKNNTSKNFTVARSKFHFLRKVSSQKIFFGFNERAILYLIIVVLGSRRDIYLLLTNNLARGRQLKVKYVYRFLNYFTKVKFIVHSDYEKSVLNTFGISSDRIEIRPHWLLINNSYNLSSSRKYDVAFFGPVKIDKDIDGFHDFSSFNIPFDSLLAVKLDSLSIAVKNITRVNTRLDREEWLNLFRSTKLVFIPLDPGYEGKLSGIFMDSIACGCKVIISNLEPYTSIFKGELAVHLLKDKYIYITNPSDYTIDLELVKRFYATFD
ncbi:hypothetical protein N9P75_01110 [Schleiferiaceae bacterium]|nr:hypothetical protein [Schleiferiaceae bacterium]